MKMITLSYYSFSEVKFHCVVGLEYSNSFIQGLPPCKI